MCVCVCVCVFLQVDPLLLSEFKAWREDPTLERSCTFLERIYREDIYPCLTFSKNEVCVCVCVRVCVCACVRERERTYTPASPSLRMRCVCVCVCVCVRGHIHLPYLL